MDCEAPMRGHRRGLRRRIWISFAALPFVLVLLGNLWLTSPLGRGWLAGKIQRRTGLEVRIGSATAAPWSGIEIRDVELLQPPPLRAAVIQPLARIGSIRLIPVWRSWLRGKRELQSIELDSPQLVVPVELLADIARQQSPAAQAEVPAPAATPAPDTPPAMTPAPPPTVPAIPEAVPQPPNAPPSAPLAPTGWVRLKNASFTLISASSGKTWFQVSDLSGSLPVSGSHAESTLRIHSVHVAGIVALTNLNTTLDWTAPVLSLKPLDTELYGMKLTVAGKIAMLGGIPTQLELQLPKQAPPGVLLPGQGSAKAEFIAGNARFRGLLLAPGTWQGDLVAEAVAPAVSMGGHDAKFDHGSAVTMLRGGRLSCVDARLIGDELSILGNATLLADGRAAAALRMVAAPDSAAAIAKKVFPGVTDPPLTPLSSPQRAAFDLEAFGNIHQLFVRLGRDGPIMELNR